MLARDGNDILRAEGVHAVRRESDAAEVYRPDNAASQSDASPAAEHVQVGAPTLSTNDFFAHMVTHQYIYRPTREMWPAVSVNARVMPLMDGTNPVPANRWLDRHRAVEQMTWAPGEPEVIRDRHIIQGGWTDKPGAAIFNLYRDPECRVGDPRKAERWKTHLKKVYEGDATHIERWLAHRVQRPGEKINHALVMGGAQGIGKDTLLEPVKYAIGAWNFAEVSPSQLLGRFNAFIKSVILRVSEARDLGDVDRYAFYDHTKTLIASPPDALRVDEKNIRDYMVPNVCGVILTTNHKTHGLYLEEDDRRHYVAWSECTKDNFKADYWSHLYDWYGNGGLAHVAAYLRSIDITDFKPKAPPPKTTAFWEIVDANRAPEERDIADILVGLGQPGAVTLQHVAANAEPSLSEWLTDRKNRRKIPLRMEKAGYVQVRNPGTTDGRWTVGSKNVAIYAPLGLMPKARIDAAERLVDRKGLL